MKIPKKLLNEQLIKSLEERLINKFQARIEELEQKIEKLEASK